MKKLDHYIAKNIRFLGEQANISKFEVLCWTIVILFLYFRQDGHDVSFWAFIFSMLSCISLITRKVFNK